MLSDPASVSDLQVRRTLQRDNLIGITAICLILFVFAIRCIWEALQ